MNQNNIFRKNSLGFNNDYDVLGITQNSDGSLTFKNPINAPTISCDTINAQNENIININIIFE